jgi:hypothetical protein
MTPEGLAAFFGAVRDITVTGAVAYGFWLFMTNRLVTPRTMERLVEVLTQRYNDSERERTQMREERDRWQSVAIDSLQGLKIGVDTTRTIVEATKSRGA